MELIEVIFAFVFIVLPLLQLFFSKSDEEQKQREGKKQPRVEEPESEAKIREPGSWSVDWGDWPEETTAAEEQLVEALPEEAFSHEMRVPEAVRVASPVVSMEPLHVDHSVDYRRPEPRKKPEATKRAGSSKQSPYARALRNPQELRNALVLSEILGPPRGLKPHD